MSKKFCVYLIGTLPLALVAGPFVGELFLFIIFSVFLFYLVKEKLYKIFNNKYFIFFLIFCFYLSVLSFFSSEILISAKSSFFYFRFGLYTLAIIYFLTKIDNSLFIIYNIYKLTLLFIILDSLFQNFFGFNFFGIKPDTNNLMRISGPFGDKFVLGSFLQKILPIFIYLIIKNYQISNKIKISDIIIVILVFSLIYRSGDRSALGLIILFSFIFFLIFKSLRKKSLLVLILFIFISGLLSIHNPSIVKRNFIDTIGQFKGKYYESFLNKEANETNLNFMIFSFHHQTHYSTAIRMFKDKPFFGHGVKMFRFECKNYEYITPKNFENIFKSTKKQYGCSTHPHNTYIQLLSETGIIGFLSVFLVFILTFIKLIKQSRKNDKLNPENILLIAIFINLWPIIPTGNFFNNWLSMLYFIPISYYFYEIKLKKKKEKIV